MVNATLERGGTSISIRLLESGSGAPLVGRDIGKPHQSINTIGRLEPRHLDNWSGLEQYTILGRLISDSAYSDARQLADLVKGYSDGDTLLLNIGMDEYDNDIEVAPAAGQEQAVNLVYEPGRRNWVDVDLGLTRVVDTISAGSQSASTPTASGDGPIQIISADGTTSVNLERNVTVGRTVGRPNSSVRRSPETYPRYFDQQKSAYDAFEISFAFTQSTVSKVQTLVDMFEEKLGRNALTLDFSGRYGLGAFDVVPEGSGALRHVRPSGEAGTSLIPQMQLRRVFQ